VRRFLTILLVLASASALASPGRVGAYVFFTRKYSKTPEELKALINDAADAGVQFLLPYARTTEGMALYDSKIMPQLPKGYDALKVVIETAHARGMKVYPWFVVNSEGFDAPTAILEQHPDWCQVDIKGKREAWLDPSCPEARQFVCSIVKEIAANYDIDGLNLDYLRYREGPHCFCDRCTSEFKAEFGLDAKSADDIKNGSLSWAKWRLFRYRQNNQFAREIRAALKEVKPDAELSAYVWGAQTYGTGWSICQDWQTWMEEGLLDWVNPMGYYSVRREFITAAKWNREMTTDIPMLVTLAVSSRRGPARTKQQIEDAMDCGADGVVFFTLEYARPMFKELSPILHKLAEGRVK
jgi:uncharacterized lipoprotein YddW (UPF0748 family)